MKKAALIIICYFISIFISNFVVARELNVRWFDGVIPGGNIAHGTLTCTSSRAGIALERDRTEDPHDVVWSDDGLTVFTANFNRLSKMNTGHTLAMNKVAEPFKVTTDLMNSQGEDVTCDAIDGENIAGNADANGGSMNTQPENIEIRDDGKIFFILDVNAELGKFNATTAFDLDGIAFERKLDLVNHNIESIAFNKEGTKLYALDASSNSPILTTFELPGANDISSKTQIHQVNLSNYGIKPSNSGNDFASDVEFSDDGFAMFVLIRNETFSGGGLPNSFIYQFRLDISFDVSTAEKVGRWNVEGFGNITDTTNNLSLIHI